MPQDVEQANGNGTYIRCPFCTHSDKRARFGFYAKPTGREHEYETILRCPACQTWYAPKTGAGP